MVDLWQVVLSVAGGVLAALISVAMGAFLSGRIQRRHWARTAQLDYFAQLLSAYSYIYNEFYKWSRTGMRPETEWSGWNNALANLSLAADPVIVQAALVIDGLFWETTDKFKTGLVDRKSWPQHRDRLEQAHVAFINCCRGNLGVARGLISTTIAREVRSEIEGVKRSIGGDAQAPS
ncbi:hypothetical protein [Micromonospora sp. NPDC048947]|uniref:hypothetical protein n=1 Tax=Micromonospora sp. NPDC048947 TaxID=3154826 RepID=UPI0033FDED2A